MDFAALKEQFLLNKGKYDILLFQKNEKVKRVNELTKIQEISDKTRILLLKTGKYQREKVIKDLKDIVSKALQFIKQEEIYFLIEPIDVRGRIELEFMIKTIRNGKIDITPIFDSRGDGISDIVSLALDIACIELSGFEGPIILDEPAKQLSGEFLINTGEFLREISHSLDRQIVLITHNPELKEIGDKKFLSYLNGNVSEITEL